MSAQFQFLQDHLSQAVAVIENWQSFMPGYVPDDTLAVAPEQFQAVFQQFTKRLEDNYPFFHPLYAGQMLKPPHPVAVIGYLTAMLINPNNHALDGGPATALMEKEVVGEFARQFGFKNHLGHLTSSGTIANLEALWIARQIHPDKAIAFSSEAHYTHRRMAEVLGLKTIELPSTPMGTLDIVALRETLQAGPSQIGTVIATLGTTALGALDSLDELMSLKQEFDFRVHVDMAYGGYYSLLKDSEPALFVYRALAHVDSVVIDPHKQGLQPYGCGCVIFSNPEIGKYYQHDSPYTYFTSSELHLGEISLECSRAGAAAAALWLTMQLFPLDTKMRAILQKNRQAAQLLAQKIQESPHYQLYIHPMLDIVTYFPKAQTTSDISSRTRQSFHAMMNNVDYPLYAATLIVSSEKFHQLHPEIVVDSDSVTIFRSCLMKPEQLGWVGQMMQILDHHAELMC